MAVLIIFLDYLNPSSSFLAIFIIIPLIFVTWYANKIYGLSLLIIFNVGFALTSRNMIGVHITDAEYFTNVFAIVLTTLSVYILVNIATSRTAKLAEKYKELKEISDDNRVKLELTSQALQDFQKDFESSPTGDLFFSLDLEKKFTDVNEYFTRLTGYGQEELLETNFADLILPDYREKFHDLIGRQLAGKSISNYFEIPLKTKSGSTIWLGQNIMLNLVHGEISGLYIIARNISDEIILKSRIEESEKRLRQIIDIVPHFIFAKDREGRFILCNKSLAEAYGTTTVDIIGKTDADFNKNQSEVDWFVSHDKEVLDTLKSKYIPIEKVTCANGEVKYLETIKIPMYMKDLEDNVVLCVANDITQRVITQKNLDFTEVKFTNFSKNAPVALTRFDLKTNKYDFVNDEFVRQSGYTLEEYEKLTQDELIQIIFKDDRDKTFREFKEWMENGCEGILTNNYRIVNKSGAILWLDTYNYADFDKNGQPIYINQICVDVTERMKAEKLVKESDERYKAFISQSTEGIYRLEFKEPLDLSLPKDKLVKEYLETGFIAECNNAFAKMYGYDDYSEMINKKIVDLYDRNLLAENTKVISDFIENGFVISNAETIEINSRGERIYFLNNAVGIVKENRLLRIWGTQNDITTQKNLQSMNLMLSEAMEQSPVAVVITDPVGNIEYVNSSYTNVTGFDRSEVHGTVSKIISNLVKERVNDLKKKGSWSGELYSKKKTGESYWEFIKVSAIKNHSGQVIHYVVMSEDITEKKLIEKAIRDSEERYKAFILQSTEGIYRMEFTTPVSTMESEEKIISHFYNNAYIAECNDVMARMYGFEKSSDLTGLKVMNMVKPGVEVNSKYDFSDFIRNGFKSVNEETCEIDSAGNVKYFLNNAIGIIENGMLVRLWGTQREITKIKLIEEEIRKLSRAVEQNPVAIAILDTRFRIEYINSRFTEFTQFTIDEIRNKIPFLFIPGQYELEFQNEIKAKLESGADWSGEFLNKRKDGSEYWESAVLSPIRDMFDNITHYLYLKQDITERKNFEIELYQAKVKAEEASKIKGDFLANISHEIRTPLNGIVGMAQLMEMTKLDEEQKEYVEIVNMSSMSLLNIINDILDFSKMENNKLELLNKAFDVRKLLDKVYRLNLPSADKKGLKFNLKISDDLKGFYIGDEHRINQVLINLVTNAIKFTNEGTVDLICEAGEVDEDDNHELIFKVKDTGVGIPESKIEYLFESFTQLENPYIKSHIGTGLGLAIVKQLLTLMGGYITVNSTEGKGSEFKARLKFKKVEETA